MTTRRMVLGLGALAAGALARPNLASAQARTFIVTEPVKSVDSLPFYIAVRKGFFREVGLDVQVMTTEGGGRHIAAVLSGDAQAFIGGPEHIAFARARGGRDIRGVASMSNRANLYFVAARNLQMPAGQPLREQLRGKRISIGTRGGTGYSIVRYLLARDGLDWQRDVTLVEVAASAGRMAAVRAGQADIAMLNEPLITQGVRQGIFNAPFVGMPQLLGPFAYTTVNVPFDLIERQPAVVEGLVRGLRRGLEITFADPAETRAMARAEFPNLSAEDLEAIIARSLSDNLWERSAAIPREAWASLHRVVREGGLLDRDMPYEEIFYPRFLA